LITGSQDGKAKRISVDNRQVDKDFLKSCDRDLRIIKITADGEMLLVGKW
jgi:hypothetical protein